jgi:hypothetical protein
MISAEEVLNKEAFLRCHKSYIINCEKIHLVKGNLKELKICTSILDFEIPVSRNISKKDYQCLLQKTKINTIPGKVEKLKQKNYST